MQMGSLTNILLLIYFPSVREYLKSSSWFLIELILSGMAFVCLQFQRRNRIYKEEQRKLRAASRKGEQVVDGTHTHH